MNNLKPPFVTLSYSEALCYCNTILPFVSRSFAIGIKALSGDIKNSVMVGYLLCRIIDTVEDDINLPSSEKKMYLKQFLTCFEDIQQSVIYSEIAEKLTPIDPSHVNLVRNTYSVFFVYQKLSDNSKKTLQKWISEMANGMFLFTDRYPNGIRINSMSEYKEYCYYVAGTVGNLLTELWKESAKGLNDKIIQELFKRAKIFGQALQSVNILKDFFSDAKQGNSIFIPQETLMLHNSSHEKLLISEFYSKTEKAVYSLFPMVYNDIKEAQIYIKLIPKTNLRIRFFCILPILLALATLKKLHTANSLIQELSKNSIKVTRKDVKKIIFYSIISCFSNKYFYRVTAKYF